MLNVNRSTYYKHFNSEPAPRIKENQSIRHAILQIYADCDKRIGAYKITYILKRDYGIRISVGRVYRLMNSMQLPSMSTEKPNRGIAKREEGICHNHLNQEFDQKSPNLVWVSDITYLKASGKWYYLCIILDLFSRKVISQELSSRADSELVVKTFRKAYQLRCCPSGLVFHSDRGTQYTSYAFRRVLDELNVVQSFSKKGYPFDNACCECFFKYLKKEETNRHIYHNYKELYQSVFKYIEGFYNTRRPHGSLGYLTPDEREAEYWDHHV